MVELGNEVKHPFSVQSRFSWYWFSGFLSSLNETAYSLGLKSPSMVHIGGTALYGHCVDTFGSCATVHFRGTHDIDFLCFQPGSVETALRAMTNKPDTRISHFEYSESNSLANKKSYTIFLNPCFDPGAPKQVTVDILEPEERTHGAIRINGRLLTPNKIIYDEPEEFKIKKGKEILVAPSLRDLFLLKMDVAMVDYSIKGLRPKDICDILVMTKICEVKSIDYDHLVDSLFQEVRDQETLIPLRFSSMNDQQQNKEIKRLRDILSQKLINLHKILANPLSILNCLPLDYPFLPSTPTLHSFSETVRRACPHQQLLKYCPTKI